LPSIRIDLAEDGDNQDLIDFARRFGSDGSIKLALDRSPDYVQSLLPEGDISQVIIGRDLVTGSLIGLGHRTEADFLSFGKKIRLGYLSGLRLNPQYKLSTALPRGYAKMKELHNSGSALAYLTTIQAENQNAKNVLGSGKAGLPNYSFLSDIITYTFSAQGLKRKKKKKITNDYIIETTHDNLKQNWISKKNIVQMKSEISTFLDAKIRDIALLLDYHSSSKRQVGNKYYFLIKKNDKVISSFALWDQNEIRRWYVLGYSWLLSLLRPFYNLLTFFFPYPVLPKPGKNIHTVFVSDFYSERKDMEVSLAYLVEIFLMLFPNAYLAFSIDAKDQKQTFLNRYPAWKIRTSAYLVYWNQEGIEDTLAPLRLGPFLWEAGCL
jgi:hypothetical protein